MTEPTSAQEAAWAELRKVCAARYAWPKRHERAPLPMVIRDGEPKREVTWGQWFRLKFGESITAYRERIAVR